MSRERDIAYGRHSRIPECCIEFFVTEWDGERNQNSPYAKAVHESDYGYVPCPSCFTTRTKVRIVICAEECGKECWREF